ncbi:NAD(P)/FAD-dependent oxidoreductase [Myceligenerans crystallogenes]|uniref:NAD(P)/FAD-dependent oxidoreductase n=1 Tax=Myceligenerans crystallogenes TaxID=316335 RepID=A0ABP4ZKQ7_9MICO
MRTLDVVVVGSGPNGLAAAVTLARAGLGVRVLEEQATAGGGARTFGGAELAGSAPAGPGESSWPVLGADAATGAQLRFDLCSAVHPMAWASPFFRAFGLADRIELRTPEVSYAQPLDPRPGSRAARAGIAYRDLDRTVARLAAEGTAGSASDGAAWRALLAPLAENWQAVTALAMSDKRGLAGPVGLTPGRLATIARAALDFGPGLIEQGTSAWGRRFAGDVAPALLTGVAAHVMTPLPSLAGAGTALLLGALAHAPRGWALPVGGSQAIVDALVADLHAHGGEIETSRPVRSRSDLPRARAYLFDTAPGVVGQVFGDRLPARPRAALRRHRFGGGAAKVDLVLSGPVPWAVDDVGRAATVHLGGTREQLAAAEADVAAGRLPGRPVCLLSDPAVTDPAREVAGLRPLWAYAHVPAGSEQDVADAVVGQIERFAPGFRDVVVAARCVPAARMAAHNANYVGGDIGAGVATMPRMLAAPGAVGWRWDPYATGVEGVYLCSAATPPGPGVHGMPGWHAARRVLLREFEIRRPPSLAPEGS